jgi:hypothetical protein
VKRFGAGAKSVAHWVTIGWLSDPVVESLGWIAVGLLGVYLVLVAVGAVFGVHVVHTPGRLLESP